MNKFDFKKIVYMAFALIVAAAMVLSFTAGIGEGGEFAKETRYKATLSENFDSEGFDQNTFSQDVIGTQGREVSACLSNDGAQREIWIIGPEGFALNTEALNAMLSEKYPTMQPGEFTSIDIEPEFDLRAIAVFAVCVLLCIIVAYVVSMLSVGVKNALIVLLGAIASVLVCYSFAVLSRVGNFSTIVLCVCIGLASSVYFSVIKLSSLEHYMLKTKKADNDSAVDYVNASRKEKNVGLVILCAALCVGFAVMSVLNNTTSAVTYGLLIALSFLCGMVLSRTFACDMWKKLNK